MSGLGLEMVLGLGLSSAAPNRSSDEQPAVTGPVAWLLSASTDLGPARRKQISVAAALRSSARPQTLFEWATDRHLTVNWEPGADWAYIEGTPADVADALKVAVHDYRSRSGQMFYAAAREPSIPAPISAEVSELGRILGYQLIHRAKPPDIPLDVPKGGLTPPELLRTYDADQLAATGITGKGQTIVFFEIDGYRQSDLDYWADKSGLSRFAPVVIGGQPAKPSVMAAVKNGLALVAAAEGPKEKFTPKNSSHPSGVNLKIANALGNSVNSFTWNEEGSSR